MGEHAGGWGRKEATRVTWMIMGTADFLDPSQILWTFQLYPWKLVFNSVNIWPSSLEHNNVLIWRWSVFSGEHVAHAAVLSNENSQWFVHHYTINTNVAYWHVFEVAQQNAVPTHSRICEAQGRPQHSYASRRFEQPEKQATFTPNSGYRLFNTIPCIL